MKLWGKVKKWFASPLRADATAAVDLSRRQFEAASKRHDEAAMIADRLRGIREMNHFAADIEFHLRGARA